MKIQHLLLLASLMVLAKAASAQTCDCTVQQVLDNTVAPCTISIGTEYQVSNVAEFRTALNTVNQAGGNATILFEDGTYEVASTAQYPYVTASNVVFRSKSGNRDAVILKGGGMRAVNGTENGIFAVGNNITIADLTIKEVGNHPISVSGDGLTVYNVRLEDGYEQLLKGVSSDGGAEEGHVSCSLFTYSAGVGPNWYIGGMDVHGGERWVVSDNVFRNIASPNQQEAEHAVHFWSECADNIVERNMIYNCDRGVGFGLGNRPNERGIIRNNFIYNDGTSLFNDVGIGLETSPGTQVYNNTIHIQYQNAIEYRFAETIDVEIANNLTNRAITSRNGGVANVRSNVIDALDTWFVGLDMGDLHLNDGYAQLIDQGEDLGNLVTDDIDKMPRESGTYDIGAQEFPANVSGMNDVLTRDLLVYPSPAKDCINVELQSNESVEIFDGLGRLVLRDHSVSGRLNVSSLAAGQYVIKVGEQRGTFVKM